MATVKSADAEARFREYAERLPSLPAVAMEVVRLAKQDWVDLSEMAEVVGHDPALSAKILKLANSPLYLRRATVATLPEAVTTLGINTLKMAALSFSVTGIAGAQSDVGGYKLTAFWRRALIQSIAGRSMATIFLRKGAEEAFLLGLLMDLSVPVLARLGGADYGPVVAAMISGHPDRDAETAALGFDHAKLSSRLLRSWSLPDVLVHAAAWHHDPDAAPTGSPKAATDLARIANLAHLSAEVMTSERKGGALAELQTRAAAWFGAEQETLITMLQEMSPAVDELAEIVKVDMGGALDAAAILEQAREELAQVSLAAAGELARAESRMSKLEKEATTDALTDLNNRATFDATLLSEWRKRKGEETPEPLGLLMIDVDHFKKFNDTYGHQTGDLVLRTVAKAIRGAVRETDTACRYGGEEFAVIAPYASGSALKALGERVRKHIEKAEIETEAGVRKVTASIGAAALVAETGDRPPTVLVECADKALYEAKREGRNRVALHDDV